jgi:CRISPR-associated endoribonuclease Cas6/Csy4 subtype I-F
MDHYLDLIARGESRAETGTLMSEAFSRVHGVLARQGGGRVGVAFPNMVTETAPHPGNVLRLFGPADDLEALREGGGIAHLAKAGGLVRGRILQAPSGDYARVRYVRDRGADLGTARGRERRQERFVRRYRARHGSEPSAAQLEQMSRSQRARGDRRLPFLRVRSRSTGTLLSIFVRPEPVEASAASEGTFNLYGLAPAGGPSVPDIATVEPFE